MPSDDPKIEDDFEDIDFDDVGEDMDDESWDDFDEDAEVAGAPLDDEFEEDPFAEGAEEAAPAKGKKAKGKKGGNSTFTMGVIGGAVVIGGAILYFTVFSGGPAPVPPLEPTAEQATDTLAETVPADAPPATDTTAALPQEDDAFLDVEELNSDLPPMPAPVESTADEMAGTIEDIENIDTDSLDLGDLEFEDGETPAAEESAEANDVLTPMPDADSMEDTELADLNFDDSEQQQETAMLEDMEAIEAMTSESSDEPTAEPVEDMAEPEMPVAAEEMPPMDSAPEVTEEAATTAETSAGDGELKALVNDLNTQLSSKEKSLSDATAENKALSGQLNKAETKITELESEIARLQNELESAQSSTSAPPQPVKTPAKTTTSEPPAAKAPETTKTVAPAPKPKAVKWTLRSASPGRATLATQDGDLRTVEVGNSVPSLGRIESIAVQGGKWVVQGSQGSVSQ